MIRASSHAFLLAEAAAFPLWHESALAAGTRALSRSAVGLSDDPLAPHARDWLCRHAAGASLPQLDHLRDLAWFPEGAREVSLAQHVARLATEHLELRGRRVGVRHDEARPFCELLERWRQVSLAAPPDLLVASLAAACNAPPPDEQVELVTPHLARVLQAPCAETHLHVGAAIPFGVLWTGLVRAVADRSDHAALCKALRDNFGDAIPFRDADRFLHLLRAASLARVAMGAFLRARTEGVDEPFELFVSTWYHRVAQQISWPWGPADAALGIASMLGLLHTPTHSSRLSHAQARALLHAALGPTPRPGGDDPHRALIAADPLSVWLASPDHPALPETRFCARALAFLLGPGHGDRAFARTFWQYQRVRSATFRTLTQEPGVAGLHWFTRFYRRIGFFRKLLPLDRGWEPSWFHALRTESRDLNLGALETRTSPEATAAGNVTLLRAVARQALMHRPDVGAPRPEVGLVLHFIKEDDHTLPRTRERRLHADPGGLSGGARHAVWFTRQRRCATAVARALADHPELLLVLRGVDVANLEQAQPTWVLRPLFDAVRAASEQASRRLAFAAPSWRVPPVRATLHAGEDYLRLTEGLRRMHEAIEFGVLRRGDRFGHGLAVGVDPESERGTAVAQPREERLDDLLWELDRYGARELPAPASRVEGIRRDALALGRAIYGDHDHVALDALLAARRLRHDPAALIRVGYPEVTPGVAAGRGAPWRLLVAHLTDRGVFLRGRAPVEVESAEDERAMLVAAQSWLQRVLAAREVTIESNPSSNLLIGDFQRMVDHPALRLRPPSGSRHDACGVHLSVNTDNPVTFGSCLGDEFAYVYAALLRQGVPASEALAWVDARREDGWRSRFTLEASAAAESLVRVLPPCDQPRPDARTRARPSAVLSGR